MIILIFGLPGSGKTTLARALSERVNGIHLNADEVRADLSSDLGFELSDRIEQARRMGAVARLLSAQGQTIIVDFVNPTKETRNAFGKMDFSVWVDRIKKSRFENTNALWEEPKQFDLKIEEGLNPEEEALTVIKEANLFDWKAPTTLMLGRYQPWHEGHHALYFEGKKRTNQVMLGVRTTQGTSSKDHLSFEEVKGFINKDPAMSNAMVIKMPNITNIIYGRDVGYKIEHVELNAATQAISATQKRKEMGI